MTFITNLLSLLKIRLTLFVALSASCAYSIKSSILDTDSIILFVSIFLLSCGAGVFNNVRDWKYDSSMNRTMKRPIPQERISVNIGISISIILVTLGMIGLFFLNNAVWIMLLGAFSIILYDFIYTPLKPKTVLAMIPGALCGMIPPLMGWLAAGGIIFDIKIWVFMLSIGLWQFPHFWLILLSHRDDYMKSAFASMFKIFSLSELKRILFVWVFVFAVMTLFIPLFGIVESATLKWIFGFNAIVLVVLFGVSSFLGHKEGYKVPYLYLNGALLVVVAGIIAQSFI